MIAFAFGVSRFVVADLEAGTVGMQLRRLIDLLGAVGLELIVESRSKRLATASEPDAVTAPAPDEQFETASS